MINVLLFQLDSDNPSDSPDTDSGSESAYEGPEMELESTNEDIKSPYSETKASNSTATPVSPVELQIVNIGDMLPDTKPSSQPHIEKRRIERSSSIRNALESASIPGNPERGLMLYFKKATPKEHETSVSRAFEEIKMRIESNRWAEEQHTERMKERERERARNRKREQRAAKRKREVDTGERSPGGHPVR